MGRGDDDQKRCLSSIRQLQTIGLLLKTIGNVPKITQCKIA